MTTHPDEQARELARYNLVNAGITGQQLEDMVERFTALLAKARLAEAEWWVPLVPNGVSEEIEKQRDERIASLRQEAGERTK